MQNDTPPGTMHPEDEYSKLAHWLQQIMAQPPSSPPLPSLQARQPQQAASTRGSEESPHFALSLDEYHPRYYQQLPDFVMALLTEDSRAATHYAPLLYHLVGCAACHATYLDLYDALHAALEVDESQPQALQTGMLSAGFSSVRLLVQLCQLLISQAEAVLKQAHREKRDEAATARALLQLAISTSTHIEQSAMRARALQDLVRVATLFEYPETPRASSPALHAYSPALTGAGARQGHKATVRKAGLPHRIEAEGQMVIHLQDRAFTGTIVQQGDVLELHLHGLDKTLRDHYASVSIPLGSLIEPIRWIGGNPHAIRSTAPVDVQGNLVTVLGHTELRLDNPQDRSLLEITFMRVEVRPA